MKNAAPASKNTTQVILAALKKLGVNASGVSDDSRQVRTGDVFLAYPGRQSDGRRFIADAVARGASAVLWESEGFAWEEALATLGKIKIPNVSIAGLRQHVGALAHCIFGQPSERLSLIALTGTNGKTSMSQWIARLHPRACACIGTLGAFFPAHVATGDSGLTTPSAAQLARNFADFCAAGAQACAFEASSVGIEEGRLDGARIDVAVFSNLTHDHLDYHGTMAHYAAAKTKLFTWPGLRLAVVNLDEPLTKKLLGVTKASKVLGYTQEGKTLGTLAILSAEAVEEHAHGVRFVLRAPQGQIRIETPLIGRFNVSNLLAVAAVLLDAGMSLEALAEGFATLNAPPGRMEKIGGKDEPLIVVDYAHTPDALENVLKALRSVAEARGGRLQVVFGCGGNRDASKRPLMGEVAGHLADVVIVTSDNPRDEDPQAIIDAIHQGCPHALQISDRAKAIQQSIQLARTVDVVLLAGKGHEHYQEIAGVKRPFSDIQEARNALKLRRGVQQ